MVVCILLIHLHLKKENFIRKLNYGCRTYMVKMRFLSEQFSNEDLNKLKFKMTDEADQVINVKDVIGD